MIRGKVVLVPFPFDDLSATKVRPAVCLTEPIGEHRHVVLAFITSQIPAPLLDTDVPLNRGQVEFTRTGLRVSSTIRLHRLMTATTDLIRRELGELSPHLQAEVARRLHRLFDPQVGLLIGRWNGEAWMAARVLDRVREACRVVAERAASVRIDERRIEPYARSLPWEQVQAPALDPRHHYIGPPAETVAYVLTLDAINFGSGYFPHLRKRPGLSGYFTVATSLKERFERHGPFDAGELRRLGALDCAEIFGQEPAAPDFAGSPRAELMGLFATALNDLGGYLLERFDGSFTGLVAAADHSAERLVGILARMPYFRDVARYGGLEVPFYKRAQLTAADLDLALGGRGLGSFHDLDRLTIFADNLVPHVLRVDGLLLYDDDLAARIDREELIRAGSPEEIEIRAVGLRAVEMLVDCQGQLGRPTTARHLDYLLWNRGQQPRYKAIPRHRARSVFY